MNLSPEENNSNPPGLTWSELARSLGPGAPNLPKEFASRPVARLVSDSRRLAEDGGLVLLPADVYFPPRHIFRQVLTRLGADGRRQLETEWLGLPDKERAEQIRRLGEILEKSRGSGSRAFLLPDFLRGEWEMQFPPGIDLPQILWSTDYFQDSVTLCRVFYGEPDKLLRVIGVTGTNGKTSTLGYLTAGLVAARGEKQIGQLGTFGFRTRAVDPPGVLDLADRGWEKTGYTSVPLPELFACLARAVTAGCRYFGLELSSHGAVLGRFFDLRLSGLIFTGFGHDHLDFHGSSGAYATAKRAIIEDFLRQKDDFSPIGGEGPTRALVLANFQAEDRQVWGSLSPASNTSIKPVAFQFVSRVDGPAPPRGGFGTGSASYWQLEREKARVNSQILRLREGSDLRTSPPFTVQPGVFFQALNSSLVMAWLLATGHIPSGRGESGLRQPVALEASIPGRFELVPLRQKEGWENCWGLVDFAHTADGLARLMESTREFSWQKIIMVLGAGGDRDRGKRAPMGEVATRFADQVILTTDNPRTEDPGQILSDIEKGCRPERTRRIPDRRQAIATAWWELDGPNQLLIVAGKGHETHQIIGREKFPFNDRRVLEDIERYGTDGRPVS